MHNQPDHLPSAPVIDGINPFMIRSPDQHKFRRTWKAHGRQAFVAGFEKIPEGDHRTNIIVACPLTTKNPEATSLHNLALRYVLG